jgi:hypothetical protein
MNLTTCYALGLVAAETVDGRFTRVSASIDSM